MMSLPSPAVSVSPSSPPSRKSSPAKPRRVSAPCAPDERLGAGRPVDDVGERSYRRRSRRRSARRRSRPGPVVGDVVDRHRDPDGGVGIAHLVGMPGRRRGIRRRRHRPTCRRIRGHRPGCRRPGPPGMKVELLSVVDPRRTSSPSPAKDADSPVTSPRPTPPRRSACRRPDHSGACPCPRPPRSSPASRRRRR